MNSPGKVFQRALYGYEYLVRRYPKAAKKRRIIKKWKKRFGEGVTGILTSGLLTASASTHFSIDKAEYDTWKSSVTNIKDII